MGRNRFWLAGFVLLAFSFGAVVWIAAKARERAAFDAFNLSMLCAGVEVNAAGNKALSNVRGWVLMPPGDSPSGEDPCARALSEIESQSRTGRYLHQRTNEAGG